MNFIAHFKITKIVYINKTPTIIFSQVALPTVFKLGPKNHTGIITITSRLSLRETKRVSPGTPATLDRVVALCCYRVSPGGRPSLLNLLGFHSLCLVQLQAISAPIPSAKVCPGLLLLHVPSSRHWLQLSSFTPVSDLSPG